MLKMKQHKIEYRSRYSNAQTARRWLRQKIEKNVKFVQFTPLPNKPTLIHSNAKQNAAVGEAIDRPDLHDDMRKIFEASLGIRKSIEQTKKDPWVFNGTLENSSEDVVPHELHSMILWILKGMYTVKAEARAHELNQSATVISQQILQAHKPKSPTATFRSTMETPITLGISLHCDHKWRSHKLASLLSHAGVGVPYQRVKQCITQIAKDVQENIEKHNGNYVPPGLHRQRRLRFSLDNIDAQVDTPDGRNSFHATAMAVYQREPSVEDAIDVVVEHVTPTQNKSARSLKDVTTTIAPLIHCTISGSPKPPVSPHYPDFKIGRNIDQLKRSEVDDLAWLLVCHFYRNAVNTFSLQCEDSQESEVNQDIPQPIPVWAAYNSLTCSSHSKVDDSYKLDKVHGLPLINSPAHEWTILMTALL